MWKGSRSWSGYGRLSMDGHSLGAHRVSYELAHGAIPHGMLVCHRCDNPPCVRPDHLFLGTYLDNNRDKMLKGRAKAPKSYRKSSVRMNAIDNDRLIQVREILHEEWGLLLTEEEIIRGATLSYVTKLLRTA